MFPTTVSTSENTGSVTSETINTNHKPGQLFEARTIQPTKTSSTDDSQLGRNDNTTLQPDSDQMKKTAMPSQCNSIKTLNLTEYHRFFRSYENSYWDYKFLDSG